MAKLNIVREFFQFLWEKKLWWIAPIIIILLAMAGLVIVFEHSSVLPFIYTIF